MNRRRRSIGPSPCRPRRSPLSLRSRCRAGATRPVGSHRGGRAMSKKKEVEQAKPAAKTKPDDSGIKVVARNRRARHNFDLLEKVEAGLVLTGTEVKSLRNGKANLEDAYAEVSRDEVWLHGCDIPEYVQANRMNHVPTRPRKLLLHR